MDWMFAGIIVLGFMRFLTDRVWRLIGNRTLAKYVREVGRHRSTAPRGRKPAARA